MFTQSIYLRLGTVSLEMVVWSFEQVLLNFMSWSNSMKIMSEAENIFFKINK